MAAPDTPVFYDPRGRRWRHVKRGWLALAVFGTTVAAIFIASVLATPLLPSFNLRPVRAPKLPTSVPPPSIIAKNAQKTLQRQLAKTSRVPAAQRPHEMPIAPPPSIPPPVTPKNRPIAIGFYINWDESSYASLKRNLDHLDWVVPQWVHLQDAPNGNSPIVIDMDVPALNLIRETRPQIRILPMVQNLFDETWDGPLLARLVADEGARQRLVDALTAYVEQNKFGGLCIDFELVPDAAKPNVLRFMQQLHAVFQPKGWTVLQSLPFTEKVEPENTTAADYLMLLAYDEHYSGGKDVGSVASQAWFESNLIERMKEIDPAKTIIAIGNYGYEWTKGNGDAREVTVQEAMISARDSEAPITFDPDKKNPYFEFEEDDKSQHTVWFLDGVTAYNQMRAASGYNPAGFALWRLGSEDPSIWSIFGAQPNSSAEALRRIIYGYEVDFQGSGELLKVVSRPHDGIRDIKVDPATGFITAEAYDPKNLPSAYVIQRSGDHPGLIALTFDDGPDPKWTNAILDVLKRENVPATFFVIGKNGQAYPDLVRRMYNEGHEIGNHTFTHPNLGEIPGALTDLEINATQRLIESLTGRSTVCSGPPFSETRKRTNRKKLNRRSARRSWDTSPSVCASIRTIGNCPSLLIEIVARTLARARDANPDTRGQVVLLHDSGGDRSATVEALPGMIQRTAKERIQVCPRLRVGRHFPRSSDAPGEGCLHSHGCGGIFPALDGRLVAAVDFPDWHPAGPRPFALCRHAGVGPVASLAAPPTTECRR